MLRQDPHAFDGTNDLDASENDSSTATAPAVVDVSHNTISTAKSLRIDIDGAGTGAKGLIVELTFTLP